MVTTEQFNEALHGLFANMPADRVAYYKASPLMQYQVLEKVAKSSSEYRWFATAQMAAMRVNGFRPIS